MAYQKHTNQSGMVQVVSISDYRVMLNEHQWFTYDDSFAGYFAFRKAEDDLFFIAKRGGPDYMREFIYAKDRAIRELSENKIQELKLKHYNDLKEAVKTGDDEFDEFAERVRRHDWFYSYSDDGSVWRNGQDRENKLLAIVKEKGGIYKAFWNRMSTIHGQRTALK